MLAIVLPLTFHGLETAADAKAISYTVVDEKISDIPIKTQIEQHIVVSGVPTKAELEVELLNRYRVAVKRRDFRYHNSATNIFIYVYATEQQARAGEGLWIGMISWVASVNKRPSVAINQDRLAALSKEPELRFGLSESSRQQIYRQIADAEDRASREARARVPDSDFRRQFKLERELGEKYKADLGRQHELTDDQLLKIAVEGVTKGWPSR